MRPTLKIAQMFKIIGHLGSRDRALCLFGNLKDRRCQTFKPGHDSVAIWLFMIEKDEKAITLSISPPFVLPNCL